MGTKACPGPHDCYAAALDDEPFFTLLARDPDAPILVRTWAAMRRIRDPEDPKVASALQVADDMEAWRNRRPAQEEGAQHCACHDQPSPGSKREPVWCPVHDGGVA